MKKSVLIIANFLSGFSSNRQASEDLKEKLEARGWRVAHASGKRFRVARLFDMLWTAWAKRNEYEAAVVTVFSGNAFIWAEAAVRLLRRLRKKTILVLRGGNLPRFAAAHPERVRRILAMGDFIVSPSEYLHSELKEMLGNGKALVIPNPVTIGNYSFRARKRCVPRLVWLRAFHGIYNPLMAVEAVHILERDFPDVRLVMAGEDKRDGSIEAARARVRELRLDSRVQIVPGIKKQEVPEWLAKGDIFLNTPRIDNMPVSVIEAMATGACVVSTNVGGIPYLLENGKDALLVPDGDAGAMAAAVKKILEDPALAENLSLRARKKAESFEWNNVLPLWEKLLEGVTGKGT